MNRLRSAFAGLAAFVATPALAGEASTLNILGFSADGGVFAFEEYGIQDGSGFPYANRFYIDTVSDTFLPGTPIRITLEIDGEPGALDEARADARTQGQDIISDAELEANAGLTVGYSPFTELSADPHRMAVNPRPVTPPIDDVLEFQLSEFQTTAGDICSGLSETMAGFRLVRVDPTPGGTTGLLHEDTTIPASRRCPLSYRIGAIQTFFPEAGDPVYAVMIQVRSLGFEGPDHRWIAIPGRF
jgi:predicted secreted protein